MALFTGTFLFLLVEVHQDFLAFPPPGFVALCISVSFWTRPCVWFARQVGVQSQYSEGHGDFTLYLGNKNGEYALEQVRGLGQKQEEGARLAGATGGVQR